MGTSSNTQVMTLVNSIIGVSILAMPFCYKQCGILLASLILIFINLMTRLSCHYLLKSAIMTKRKNFEFLAFHAFGTSGKTAIELCIILLMIGTCIAFFVVMGDLGPAIISSLLNMEFSAALRPAVLIGLAVFVVLPLGMLRNVDSLSFICTLSFLFYLLLVLKVFFESTENLFSGFWLSEVQYWRPAGILQCLPIFSMALSCQSQLFEVFDSVTNATLDRMNLIVKYAVDLCTALYISVGVLGYIAYYKMPMTGNLLMSFSESLFSEIIKLLFVLSVAVTFPLVIFPCRASLYSLLFKKAHVPHYELVTGGGNHIPEAQFKCITLFIITTSLIVGLLAPNIEIVLGLVGSTIGVIICLLFPPLQFIWICNKATTEKILAQAMCMVGLFIMIMGTYANLYLSDSSNNNDIQKWKGPEPLQAMESKVDIAVPINHLEVVDVVKPSAKEVKDLPKSLSDQKKPIIADEKILKPDTINDKLAPVKEDPKDDKRVEPPIPIAPEVIKSADKISPVQVEAEKKIKDIPPKQPSPKIPPSSAQLLNEPAKIPSDQNVNQKSSVAAPNQEEPPLKANDLLQKPALESQKNIESNNIAEPAKQNDIKADQKVNSGQVSPQGVSDFVKSKPPLPILMQKEKSDDKKVEGDMLGNIKNPSEREKRDLFATNATLQQIDIPQVNIGADINAQHNIDGGFVKNVASSVNANQSCDKDKVPKTKQLSDVHNLQVEPNIKETVVENLPNKKEDFILAPAKLSDPSLMLDHKVSENEALKVHPESMMKPMLRELKAVKEKADRKK